MNFNLDTTYGYNNDIHKSKIIKYKPNNLATMNTVNSNINIILNREENHLNLRDSYLELSLEIKAIEIVNLKVTILPQNEVICI